MDTVDCNLQDVDKNIRKCLFNIGRPVAMSVTIYFSYIFLITQMHYN